MKSSYQENKNIFFVIKKKYLSHDSSISIVINNFLNKFKKKENKTTFEKSLNKLIEQIGDSSSKKIIPFSKNPTVSIIIPCHNQWLYTYRCVSSIIHSVENISYEIIIADDCSNDETKKCTGYFENIIHIRTESNIGFLKNCNHAALHASGKYIVLLNNDTLVMNNWLSSLLDTIENNHDIGLVGSKLIYPDGRLQEAGGIIWDDGNAWNYGRYEDPEQPEYNYLKEVDYISGASILVPKKIWDKIGGFNEMYSPAYCEDSDLALTIRQLGYKILYQPLSVVVHFEGISHGQEPVNNSREQNIKSYQIINNEKFRLKWHEYFKANLLPHGEKVFLARDKSQHKKSLLVIDHYAPTPDKDAGSKTMIQYLQLFVSMGYNIKFIGDNFHYMDNYTISLQQMGIEVLYGQNARNNLIKWMEQNGRFFDYIFLSRPSVSINYIELLKKYTKAKILYYGHDLHFLREQRRFEIEKNEKILKNVALWKKREVFVFNNVDIIMTPNYEEKNEILKIDSSYNVETILPFFYAEKAKPVDNFNQRHHIMFVGGFSHGPNVDAVKWFVESIWPTVKNQIKGINFLIVGSNIPPDISVLAGESIKILQNQTDEELYSLYESIRMVVIPLRFGAGVKGKTVECMNKGVPLVSTSIGIEGLENINKIISANNDELSFAEKIIDYYNNEEKLKELSEKEANYINNYFSLEIARKKMEKLFN